MHLKEKVDYAIKVVENGDLTDEENLEALEQGVGNLEKQIENVRQFGVPVVVAIIVDL